MFTGIVQGTATIVRINRTRPETQLARFRVRFPLGALDGVQVGASIAVNGTCLTVTNFDQDLSEASFDVIAETLDKTNLSCVAEGDRVNFERAARIGDEIGGHLMSGHVMASVAIIDIVKSPENVTLIFKNQPDLRPYLLTKGFVGLNGCSLTLGEVTEQSFCVHLIPETLAVTTFGDAQIGDKVNVELDPQTQTIVDTVRAVMEQGHYPK